MRATKASRFVAKLGCLFMFTTPEVPELFTGVITQSTSYSAATVGAMLDEVDSCNL